jgi:hypothetical protein
MHMDRKKTVRRIVLGLALAAALALLTDVDRAAGRTGVQESRSDRIIGIKVYDTDADFRALFEEWRSLGINTAFVSPALAAKPGFRYLAREGGIDIFLILPIFFNDEALTAHPELQAVNKDGKPAVDDWVKFICPSREDYRKERVEWVRKLVQDLDPDGISLDFIRTFVFWEMVAPDRTLASLPNACFCPVCLKKFQDETGVEIPADLTTVPAKYAWIDKAHLGEWTDWKCGLITSMVRDLAAAARAVKPSIKVNLHAVPWRSTDFGGAIKIVAGQDLPTIGGFVDLISPMCYHHMVRQTPAWVHSVVEDMTARTRMPILPSIQVKEAYRDEPLSVEEFRAALVEALKPLSRGVVFWSWDSLGPDAERKAVVRSLCAKD